MAARRMLAKVVLMSDAFLVLSNTAMLLYIYLNLNADDEGFLNNPKLVMRICGASEVHLTELVKMGLIFQFESGVVVICHWLLHNSIARERRHKSENIAERAYIAIDESTKVYVLVSGTDFPDAEGLLSLDDFSSTRDGVKRSAYGHFDNVLLSDKEHSKLQTEFPDDYDARIDRLSTYIESSGKQYRNHYAAIRSWAKNDQKKSASSNNPFLELAGGSYD